MLLALYIKQMINFDLQKWEAYDPDGILNCNIKEIEQKLSSKILCPREDLMYFDHKLKSLTIDFGFYGDEVTNEGEWVVYVIDTSEVEPWLSPIERLGSKEFICAISNIQKTIDKFT